MAVENKVSADEGTTRPKEREDAAVKFAEAEVDAPKTFDVKTGRGYVNVNEHDRSGRPVAVTRLGVVSNTEKVGGVTRAKEPFSSSPFLFTAVHHKVNDTESVLAVAPMAEDGDINKDDAKFYKATWDSTTNKWKQGAELTADELKAEPIKTQHERAKKTLENVYDSDLAKGLLLKDVETNAWKIAEAGAEAKQQAAPSRKPPTLGMMS